MTGEWGCRIVSVIYKTAGYGRRGNRQVGQAGLLKGSTHSSAFSRAMGVSREFTARNTMEMAHMENSFASVGRLAGRRL